MKIDTVIKVKHALTIWGYTHYAMALGFICVNAPLFFILFLIGFGLIWNVLGSIKFKLVDWLLDAKP